nr:3119_t:CDS:2 [Entrophospora candida]
MEQKKNKQFTWVIAEKDATLEDLKSLLISELTLPDGTETEDVTIYIKNKQEKHLISNNEDLLRYFWSKIRFQNDEADVNLIVETELFNIGGNNYTAIPQEAIKQFLKMLLQCKIIAFVSVIGSTEGCNSVISGVTEAKKQDDIAQNSVQLQSVMQVNNFG